MYDARLEIRSPRLFTSGAILALTLYGILVSAPVVVAMLAVSVRALDVWTYAVPLGALAAATFFLPLGFGNPLVVRLVRSLPGAPTQNANRFIVQLSLAPRLRSGWRAVIEDADDIGWLEFSDLGLSFQGDSISLSVPYGQVVQVRLQNSGWRGLFACGTRLTLNISGLPQVSCIQFAERSSWVVPDSRRNARAIYQALARRVPANQSKPKSG